ncbi:hypothetical protein [Curtobacterium sp. ISL-83]|uniref:hypothetical protein n=1 Tax=Curtobacterium sp. ISL-83 TaxID=2819145 RepID=UPI001BEBF433|nr:hypothetical protein [Curtobacterium sp. ISL-83]MBT2503499.1 hypothetical protein [Curtobacterium sp. ISL-83]
MTTSRTGCGAGAVHRRTAPAHLLAQARVHALSARRVGVTKVVSTRGLRGGLPKGFAGDHVG